jgi:hypothetical protein
MLNQMPDLEKRCGDLDTWSRWAGGAAVDKMLNATGPHANHCRALGRVVRQWATTNGIELPTPLTPSRTRQIVGPDLGR